MDRTTWLSERRKGIGGSDVAAALGLSPWKTPLQLYLDKRGELPEEPESPQMRRGKLLEPFVLRMYSDETGHATGTQSLVIPPEPWMLGTLDATDVVECVPVEAKTVNAFATRDFGLSGSDDVPMHYAAQVHWYMAMTDTDHAYLAALIGNDDFRIFRLERDADLERAMIDQLREFWRRVQEGDAPDPQTAADLALLYKSSKAQCITASEELLNYVWQARKLKDRIRSYETNLAEYETAIKLAMGAADTLLGADGKPIVTWKSQSARRFDQKAFGEVHPDLLEEFKRTSETRVLRIR